MIKSLKKLSYILIAPLMFIQVSCSQSNTTQVKLMEQAPYGQFLVDGQGMSLYLFLNDTAGTSTCYDGCAVAWPPLLTKTKGIKAGKGINESMLGTVERKDGSLQVTYNGHPLYYYATDKKPGDVTGQDLDQFGEEWYLVKSNGNKMGDVE